MIDAPCGLVVTPLARRAIESGLPEAAAIAVIDFVTTTLIANRTGSGSRYVTI